MRLRTLVVLGVVGLFMTGGTAVAKADHEVDISTEINGCQFTVVYLTYGGGQITVIKAVEYSCP